MLRQFTFYFFLLLIACSCEKEIQIVKGEDVLNDSINPGVFDVIIDEVTDNWIMIHWTESVDQSGRISYEVLVEDSVVEYETNSRFFKIKNLMPGTKYSISVVALDSMRNFFKVTKEITTKKSFIQKFITFDRGYNFIYIDKAIATSDNGIFVIGRFIAETLENTEFIYKLDSTYKIVWSKEYEWKEELIKIKELSDGVLLIRGKTITKIGLNGEEVWKYNAPEKNVLFSFKSAVENKSGNIILVGESFRKWAAPNLQIEYYISELSSAGVMVWEKYGGDTLKYRPIDVIQKPNGNYFVFGTSISSFDFFNKGIAGYWVLEVNQTGDFIKQFEYPSQFKHDDSPKEIIKLNDDRYLLLGTATGGMGPNFNYNFIPHFTMINSSGDLIWNKTYSVCIFNVYPMYKGSWLENENLLFIATDDEGSALASINFNGDLISTLQLKQFSKCFFVKRDKYNNYILLTHNGWLAVCNSDGYIQ